MIKKNLLYIIGFVTFCACSDDEPSPYLNGKEKTPLEVVTNLTAGKAVTRAVDGEFEEDDVMVAYIKHVLVVNDAASPLVYASDVSGTGVTPKLAQFKVSSLTDGHKDNADNSATHENSSILQVLNTEGLYWDDFSASTNGGELDLRTVGHALMVDYGYCYNGSPAAGETGTSITSALVEADVTVDGITTLGGTLGWKVAADQSDGDAYKHSDLLWCKQQTPIKYNHVQTAMPKLVIPYTHAMSKVTVEVHCENGFDANDANNFDNASVKLTKANTKSTLSARNAQVTPSTNSGDQVEVTMKKASVSDNKKVCVFTAVIAPTVIKADSETPFATLYGIDGNDYKLFLTNNILTTTSSGEAWSTQLAAYNATTVTPIDANVYNESNGGLTKPGVNYKIIVTIDKQANTVSATIAGWTDVTAEGIGKIQFANDVTTTGSIADDLKTLGFDVYKKSENGTSYDSDASTENTVDPITKITWDSENTKWKYSPIPYWQNKDDKAYFRALAPTTATTALINGSEVLWATTPAHNRDGSGNTPVDYTEGGLLDPRTGDVPLAFKHVMSKITFNLVDANDGSTDPGAAIDFNKTTIQITKLYTEGTLSLEDGTISTSGKTISDNMFSVDESSTPKRMGFYAAKVNDTDTSYGPALTIKDYAVTPQSIGDDPEVIITLANGTTYRLKLKECKDSSDALISSWEPGKHYIYTITLSKEQITFRALVKEWEEKNGSGSATLDWD